MEKAVAVRCQRIGCDATFTEEANVEGSCRYHDSLSNDLVASVFFPGSYISRWNERMELLQAKKPRFQLILSNSRARKEAKAKRREKKSLMSVDRGSHRCKMGKHTTEKPATKAVSASPQKPVTSAVQNKTADVNCSRCRQGFFCSDHGAQPRASKPVVAPVAVEINQVKSAPAPSKKIVDFNEPQTCKNKGCGKTFKEKDNHATACEYHPGPPIFHDRIRGWKCCDIHVKEFDEFVNIPPCTKGWHNADAA